MIGFLHPNDLVEVLIGEPGSVFSIASAEFYVRAAVYRETHDLAIIYPHLVAATALTLLYNEIIPIDVEGSYHTRKIPSVEFEFGSGSEEMAEVIPKYLKNCSIIMIKGHGSVAAADTLEEAAFYTSSVENSAKIIFYVLHAGRDPLEFEPERLKNW